MITLLLLGILLVLPLVLAQEQAQTYSGFNRFTDDVKIFFASGDNKVKLALEIREKEIDSAISNSQNHNEKDAIKNLERAHKKLQLIQEKVSLGTAEEIKTSVEEITNKINNENNLPKEFDEYILEEEKTQLTAELTKKTFEWCKEIAKEDYTLILQEEKCNPKTAQRGLQKELKELKNIQEELFVKLMLDIRSCIDDPGTCNCDDNIDIEQKAKCEKMVAIAVKCEYNDDENACSELKSLEPIQGDGFAESFVPDFLMNLFKKKSYMIDYNIEKSDVPPECYNENNKPECEQYKHMKETSSKCWDKDGNFLEEKCGGPEDKGPTMQESIPQCYDGNNNFLEEKCGQITMIINEGGLVNYIIEKEIENIIDKFENASEQHTIDVNGTDGQTMTNEIKEEIDGIKEQIAERTFAPGTYETGESGKDIKSVVVEKGKEGFGDGGLKPEVETDVAGDGSSDDGLVVKTDVAGGNNNVIEDGTVDVAGGNNNVIEDGTVVEDGINDVVKDGKNQIDKVPKEKENEDVSPAVNEVDDEVDGGSGEPGVVDED